MDRLTWFLFLTIPLLASGEVLFDSKDCRHFRCHWIGENCVPLSPKSHKKEQCEFALEHRYEGQTDFELVHWLQNQFPQNQFFVDKIVLDKKCEQKRLCCIVDPGIRPKDYEKIIESMRAAGHPIRKPPCTDPLTLVRARRS